jgi:hypothetical protein
MLLPFLLHRFIFRGLDNPRVYYNKNALHIPGATREKFADLNFALLVQGGTVRAREVLARVGETEQAIALLERRAVVYERTLRRYFTPG